MCKSFIYHCLIETEDTFIPLTSNVPPKIGELSKKGLSDQQASVGLENQLDNETDNVEMSENIDEHFAIEVNEDVEELDLGLKNDLTLKRRLVNKIFILLIYS